MPKGTKYTDTDIGAPDENTPFAPGLCLGGCKTFVDSSDGYCNICRPGLDPKVEPDYPSKEWREGAGKEWWQEAVNKLAKPQPQPKPQPAVAKPIKKKKKVVATPAPKPVQKAWSMTEPCATCQKLVRVEAAMKTADGRLFHQKCSHPDKVA